MADILTLNPRARPLAPAGPIHRALDDALAIAASQVISGSIASEAVSPDHRLQLERRQREIADSLVPAADSQILALLASISGMVAKREVSRDQAKLMILSDLAGLRGLPEWALRSAIEAFRSGRIGDGRFRPLAGEIRIEAAKRVASHQSELAKITRVLSAKIEPPRKPIDPERRKQMADLMRRGLSAAIAESDMTRPAEAEKRAEAPARAKTETGKSAEQLAEEFAAQPLATSDALRRRLADAKPPPATQGE